MGGVAPVVVVANPTAGRGKAGKRIGAVDSILRELRVEHEVRVTGSAEETETACRDAANEGAEIVAIVPTTEDERLARAAQALAAELEQELTGFAVTVSRAARSSPNCGENCTLRNTAWRPGIIGRGEHSTSIRSSSC